MIIKRLEFKGIGWLRQLWINRWSFKSRLDHLGIKRKGRIVVLIVIAKLMLIVIDKVMAIARLKNVRWRNSGRFRNSSNWWDLKAAKLELRINRKRKHSNLETGWNS